MYSRTLRFLGVFSFLFVVLSSAAYPQDGWIPLFDGKTLNGWRAGENPGSFHVVDGSIAADGPRASTMSSPTP